MRIGIVVYSWSGNTLAVAERLSDALSEQGHEVDLLPLRLVGERERGARTFQLDATPALAGYEGLVFGAAVEAFSLSPVLAQYLDAVESLDGKSIACLVTQQFPYAWMGGNRAIRQMQRLCRAKDATIAGSAVVHWAQSRREPTTAAAVAHLSGLFAP
jgi:hypothetical protein